MTSAFKQLSSIPDRPARILELQGKVQSLSAIVDPKLGENPKFFRHSFTMENTVGESETATFLRTVLSTDRSDQFDQCSGTPMSRNIVRGRFLRHLGHRCSSTLAARRLDLWAVLQISCNLGPHTMK